MIRIVSASVFGLLLLQNSAFALCSSYPNTLTNGTIADAGQVMADFNCAALTSGATINGATFTGTTTFPGTDFIDTSGNLNIGSAVVGVAKLYVLGHAFSGYVARFDSDFASAAALQLMQPSTVSQGILVFNNSAGVAGSVTISGTSVVYNTTSDQRLKVVVPEQHNYRSNIESMWVGDFEWKKDHTRSFGILAQQAFPFYPEAITKPNTESDLWQADYGRLAPLALWGVKDIYKLVDEQSRQLATLRQVNDRQASEIDGLKAAANREASQIALLATQMAELQHRGGVRTAEK